MSSARSEHLTLGYLPPRSGSSTANNSPTEPSSGSALRSPFGIPGGLNSAGKMASNTRSGAGSPSHELGGTRTLYSKRYAKLCSFPQWLLTVCQSARNSAARRPALERLGSSNKRQFHTSPREHPRIAHRWLSRFLASPNPRKSATG